MTGVNKSARATADIVNKNATADDRVNKRARATGDIEIKVLAQQLKMMSSFVVFFI
jgi:hypothetical protein